MSAKAQMIAKIEARTTEQLFADLAQLEKSANAAGFLPTPEQRMVQAMISDAIETRHGLTPALDAIFTDEYAGTYSDALLLAYAAAAL